MKYFFNRQNANKQEKILSKLVDSYQPFHAKTWFLARSLPTLSSILLRLMILDPLLTSAILLPYPLSGC